MNSKLRTFSRRDFLTIFSGAIAGTALFDGRILSQQLVGGRLFNMLVIGDSIISGQGLELHQKSYTLVKEWLEKDVFAGSRQVALKVKAHSGASINIRPVESDALQKAGIDENKEYPDEVNFTFPSIRSQVDTAAREYPDPASVDLILLTGGITDTRLTTILNPFKGNDELQQEIVKHCYEDMLGLLTHTAKTFPNALIVLVGYYPFISKYSPKNKILSHVLEVEGVPELLKPLINNPLNRQLLKYYTKKMALRSMMWAEGSTAQFKKAVDRVNADTGKQRAIFVESPLKEENSLGAKNSLIFEFDKNDELADPMAAKRMAACAETVPPLHKATKMKLRTRRCDMAGIGHPNPAGAKLIAEAIQHILTPSLKPSFKPQ